MKQSRNRQAFTLVELSIVLVILGLLVGGVLSGQSLIHSAELRAITTEQGKYATALNSFRDKYFGIPGDITNATAFWGKDNTNCSTNTGTAATPGTCNGDGNGILGNGANGNFDIPSTTAGSAEVFRAIQQLAMAGLIEGSYTGTASATTAVIGVNVPKSKLNNAGWTIMYRGGNPHVGFPNSSDVGTVDAAQYMIVGAASAYGTDGGAITPTDGWNIDTKMDDGKPGQGNVRAGSVYTGCSTTYDTNGTYNVGANANMCALFFMVK